MTNKLIHVTNFPYNSVVVEQYLLVSDGMMVASVAFVIRDSVTGDDAIEVRIGNNEPYEVEDREEALTDLRHAFGGVDRVVNMTIAQVRSAGLIG